MVDEERPQTWRGLAAGMGTRMRSLRRRPDRLAVAGLVASILLAGTSVISATRVEKAGARVVAVAVGSTASFVLPEIVADLRPSRSKSHYVQLAAVIEVPEEALHTIQTGEGHVLSEVQSLLRDLQREDLAGAAGIELVRRGIRAVVDRHIAPARTQAVLFTKFLVD
jgi:hypothetical protein